MSARIRQDCPKTKCRRHTLCDECETVHGLKGGLPFCKRPQLTLWGRIQTLIG